MASNSEVDFQPADVSNISFTSVRKNGSGRARSEHQTKIDNLVLDGYGKDFIGVYVANDETVIETMKKNIRKSSEYLDLGVRFGHPVETKDTGIVILTFKVTDRIRRPRKTSAE